MEGPANNFGCGKEKQVCDLRRGLAKSFARFVNDHANDEIRLVACFDLDDGVEAIQIEFPTGTHQQPVHDVRPIEPLLVMFDAEGSPLIASLRPTFPFTQHTFGLEMAAPTDAKLALCIDDRAWEDASPDYNGAELVRRIASWFARAISGKMNDELQFRDPVFLPSPASIIVRGDLEKQVMQQQPSPVFLALVTGDKGSDTFFAYPYDDAPTPRAGKMWTPYLAMSLMLRTNNDGAMWHAPSYLGELRDCVSGAKSDLLSSLRDQLSDLWSKLKGEDRVRLRLAELIVHVVIKNEVSDRYETYWLMVRESASDIAVGLGILYPPIKDGDVGEEYVPRLPPGSIDELALAQIPIFSANSFSPFGSDFGNQLSDLSKIGTEAAIVGAGSIGSQIASHLVREGAFERLTLIDDDRLLPHNLARHALTSESVSFSKASKLAELLTSISPGLPVKAISAKLGSGLQEEEILTALADASVVYDFTASVGASRAIADLSNHGRAVSAFFNPAGDAYAVLVEDAGQMYDLAALEACYYAEIILNDDLAGHLSDSNRIVVSSGQCRSVSNRLSSSDAALLSAAASRTMRTALSKDTPGITIGVICEDGSLKNHAFSLVPTSIEHVHDAWTIRMSGTVEARIRAAREVALPNETGGVLLGIVDFKRKRVEIAYALPPPPDSQHATTEFVRGVQDLQQAIENVSTRVMHQLAYVGEWHSHPKGAAANPSLIDQVQLDGLSASLKSEDRPGVMVIVGERETRIYGR